MLDALARLGGGIPALELRGAHTDMPNVDAVDGRLLERGLICHPSRGRDDFALPLFRSYLRGERISQN